MNLSFDVNVGFIIHVEVEVVIIDASAFNLGGGIVLLSAFFKDHFLPAFGNLVPIRSIFRA